MRMTEALGTSTPVCATKKLIHGSSSMRLWKLLIRDGHKSRHSPDKVWDPQIVMLQKSVEVFAIKLINYLMTFFALGE